jgi:hypothetical protein
MNFLLEKKYGVPSHNFVKKIVLCEKGDEITRFDGTSQVFCHNASGSSMYVFSMLAGFLRENLQELETQGLGI